MLDKIPPIVDMLLSMRAKGFGVFVSVPCKSQVGAMLRHSKEDFAPPKWLRLARVGSPVRAVMTYQPQPVGYTVMTEVLSRTMPTESIQGTPPQRA